MANTADVVVRFLADTAQVDGATKSMGSTIKGFAKSAAGFFGGVAIGAFAKDAVQAASDMNESMNKVNVVFGKSAGTIQRFAEDAAQNLGLSTQAALDAAGAYGNMFTQLGFGPKVAADMSKGMLTLTADLASFHNADPTAVLEAQQAAFRGEYDAVQKFIPTINAAAVEQRALADTHKASTKELTAGEKAAAAYALMVEGAGAATGDWAATADSAANQQRTMNAEMQNAEASIGQALLPALQVVVPWIAAAATAFADAEPEIQKVTVALAGFGAIALIIGGTVGLIVAAIGAIGVGLFLMWTHWDEIWQWIVDNPVYGVLIGILAAPVAAMFLIVGALKFLWENWSEIWGWIKQAASDAAGWVTDRWNEVTAFFKGIPGVIRDALSTVWDFLTRPFIEAEQRIEDVFDGIKDIVRGAVNVIKSVWNPIADSINAIHINTPGVSLPFVGEVIPSQRIDPFPIDVPRLAAGGVVSRATLALIGESGPEAVVPLDRGFGTTNVYTINVDVAPGANPAEVGAAVVDQIRAYEQVAGRAWRATA